MIEDQISLSISDNDKDVAYVYLPGHQGKGVFGATPKQIRLSDILSYKGPDIYLDLDLDGRLVGIEILA